MDNKKLFKKAKNIFTSLKTDPSSMLFSEEKIDSRLLKKLKKSKYAKDKLLLKLVLFTGRWQKNTYYSWFFQKREIDRSTLYNFDGTFQLIHADIENLEFLGSTATTPRYLLLIVDLYSSKICVYRMHSRKQIVQNMALFCDEIKNKRKNKQMRLQVNNEFQQVKLKDDNEFQQVKLKDLNEANNAEMFTTSVRGGKAFAAEQKIRELKKQKLLN